ncbi:HAMP domain-containing protein [Shewanella algae]|nr:HAMP domain-containing protein [Shewanella algae]
MIIETYSRLQRIIQELALLPFSGLFSQLQWRLFGYFGVSLLLILLLASGIEAMLLNRLLLLPQQTQSQLQQLADEANDYIVRGDIAGLADWEGRQAFVLYVLDSEQQAVSQREMHPHFVYKLNFLKQLQQPMGDRVQKPLIGLPLRNSLEPDNPLLLVVQLNASLHPAQQLDKSLWLIRILVGLLVLLLFSRLLSRYLIQPLSLLRSATRQLAQGQLDTRIAGHFSLKQPEFFQLATDFDHMAEQLQKSIQTQQRLLRDVSHELRTPLARQELALHLLENRLGEEHQQPLARLRRQGEEMAQLINTILDFSRLSNGFIKLTAAPFTLTELRRSLLQDLEFESGPKQSIVWAQAPIDEQTLHTDMAYLKRALENVCRNALKYAGETCRVEIQVSQLGDDKLGDSRLQLSVSDDGPGIPKEQLEALFNPFTRLDEARHSSQGGYGLGLAIVRQCMQLLGGSAQAVNRPQGGLSILLELPLQLPNCSEAQLKSIA